MTAVPSYVAIPSRRAAIVVEQPAETLTTASPAIRNDSPTFHLEDELLEGLSLVEDRDGIPLTEHVTGIRQSAITYHRYLVAALGLALEPDLRPPFR